MCDIVVVKQPVGVVGGVKGWEWCVTWWGGVVGGEGVCGYVGQSGGGVEVDEGGVVAGEQFG